MTEVLTLQDFLDNYGENMAEKVTQELNVIHEPGKHEEPEIGRILSELKKKPFASQAEIIKATTKSLLSGNKAVYTVCECGTGKTLMAISVAKVLNIVKGIRRVLVLCPPHLVPKWIKEIRDSVHDAKAYNLNGKDALKRLQAMRNDGHPHSLEFCVIGRERAKTNYLWRPAAVKRMKLLCCPRCGQELLDEDGVPLSLFERNTQGRYRKRYTCSNTVPEWKHVEEKGTHELVNRICGEQLWQPDTTKRQFIKYMPARYIKSHLKGRFDLLVADEAHQFKNTSGQGYAFGALASACKYVLCLTGTLAGGYASDVYHLLFRTHPQLMLEDGATWGNPKKFIEKYGVLEKVTTVREEDGLTTKAKKRVVVKEKPGISPLLLGKMLLTNSVFLRLGDCMEHLQPYEEDIVELGMSDEMRDLYREFEGTMKDSLIQALASGDNSLLGAYVNSLLSYPDRMFEGITVLHPRTKDIVAVGPRLEEMTPKEQELLSITCSERALGRKVLVYIQNSDTTDISPRLVNMLEAERLKVKVLKSGNTEGRSKIIDNWVKKGIDVLITNPKKVEVGLDLLDFPTIVFYQTGYSTYTLRQASRRSCRIPQKRPVKVYFLTYSGTMQTRCMALMADKLMCSLALEGELTDKGLAALSESSDSMAKELAKMLVERSHDSRSLRDVWADYRKKEVGSEQRIGASEPLFVEQPQPTEPEVQRRSISKEKIGDRIIKVEFVEYSGKRKKKKTHIEVTNAELEQILNKSDKPLAAQFTLF